MFCTLFIKLCQPDIHRHGFDGQNRAFSLACRLPSIAEISEMIGPSLYRTCLHIVTVQGYVWLASFSPEMSVNDIRNVHPCLAYSVWSLSQISYGLQ